MYEKVYEKSRKHYIFHARQEKKNFILASSLENWNKDLFEATLENWKKGLFRATLELISFISLEGEEKRGRLEKREVVF